MSSATPTLNPNPNPKPSASPSGAPQASGAEGDAYQVQTPVVLIVFNRPRPTRATLSAIRAARPRRLLVISDGPRADRANEAEIVEYVRTIIDTEVDWACRVERNYSEVNLGCGKRIASGLDWVFERTEEAIILEDDCVPHPSFFEYCDTLLARYRQDRRVMHIGGNNFVDRDAEFEADYAFSKYNHIWGWATWRRAWQYFDHDLTSWPTVKQRGMLDAVCDSPAERRYWTGIFDQMHARAWNVWGYAWTYACFMHGLSVYPARNLVSNIGFDADATHCTTDNAQAALPAQALSTFNGPATFVRDAALDRVNFSKVFGGASEDSGPTPARGLRGLLRRVLKR